MAEEAFGWLFVGHIPLIYEKKRLAKQFQIETWLDLAQVMKELNLEKTDLNKQAGHQAASYIV